MEEVILQAKRRDVLGKQVKALRRQGQLPAVLYGRGVEPTPIVLDSRDATRILSRVGSSALVTVDVDGEKHLVLVRERQRDFIRGDLKHIDFQVVSMKEKLRVKVRIELVGESSALKDFNGVLVTGLNELEIECLPQDLPAKIVVDISLIKQIGQAVYVHDLAVSDKVHVLNDQDALVVVVTGQAAEEVAPVVEGAVATEEPEIIEKGKKEEEAEA